ncbi:hypothetical protein [Streptomyces sp. LNU-CPARS28]|uniref:hypothetical protein n=1 Tax=Streptomyces sp. LNU-CPARS28 TaxID=3137371 RepID=UPI003134CD35
MNLSRRSVVKVGAVGALGAALAPGVASAAPGPEPLPQPEELPTSANGWTVETRSNSVSTVWTRPVAGTGLEVDVRIGDVEAILVHVVRRFHYEIEEIPRVDLSGWQPLGKVSRDVPASNLASGTAVRIRPGSRVKGGFFPLQEVVLRDVLADCEGVVRWAGDDEAVDESLFYVDVGPDDERVRRVADKFRAAEATPGRGAGAPVDVQSRSRQRRAEALTDVQRSA